ncbi:MAG: hypothetical protein ACOH2F_07300 [Cellulomonas sp.]
MPTYLARITVSPVLDAEERRGMGDALGAHEDREESVGRVTFEVLGEAPDPAAASSAAYEHAAGLLDGYLFEVDVSAVP